MKRVVGIARGRAGRVGLVTGVIVAAVVGLSAPAFAHHAILSGATSCSNGNRVVTWTIGNSENDKVMTITSATAAVGAQSYAVSGYSATVGNGGSTTATSNVPGGVSGSIVLSVSVKWTNGVKWSGQASVYLLNNCSTTTTHATTTTLPVTTTTKKHCGCTTTTVADTTTTLETTTTIPQETTTSTTDPVTTTSIEYLGSTTIVTTSTTQKHATTTLGEQGSTVPTTQPTSVAVPTLPHTGSGTTFPVIFGGICVAAGAALALRKRGTWSHSE